MENILCINIEKDHSGKGSVLALFKLEGNKLLEVYSPMIDEAYSLGERQVNRLISLLKEEKIKKVYSVFHLEDFFGVPAFWFSTYSKEYSGKDEEVRCWIE